MNTTDGSSGSVLSEQTPTSYKAPKLVVLGSAGDLTQGATNNLFSDTSAFHGQGVQASGGG